MGSVSVLSYICCMFVSCVPPVAVLNAEFCMTCSLLMLVEDVRGDHMEEAYSRDGLSSPVSLQLLRGGILPCMRCPCLCICWVLGWGLC